MGWMDEYNKALQKKRKENAEQIAVNTTSKQNASSWMDDYYTELNRLSSEDSAPTAPTTTVGSLSKLLTEEEDKKWYEKGLFEDGYDFGDVAKTILGISDKKKLKTFEAPDTTDTREELKQKVDYLNSRKWHSAEQTADILKYSQQYNQMTLYQYADTLSKTKMDGSDHTVLEEIEILANMKSGKEKDKRKQAVLKKMESLGMDSSFYAHFAGDGEFDWDTFGEWALNASMAGLNTFNKGLMDTADVILGAPLKAMGWEDNPISEGAEYYNNLYSNYRYNANMLAEKLGGNAWNFGTDAIEGTTGALPNALLMFMTGGASATTTTNSLMNQAAMQTGNFLTKAGLTAETMMKNPQYWMSFARTLGSDYKEAKEMGASDTAAAVGSVLKSTINSGIEIGLDGGSGIQGLDDALKKGGKPFWEWVESSVEEGGEEILQKFVGEAVNKFGYGSDEEILNPIEYAKEGTLGMLSGMALGGGQTAVQSGVNAYNQHQADKLTDIEQSVKDKIVEKRIAQKEKDGKTLTAKEKADIEKEVDRNLRKGYLSADDIEEAIGGEAYESFKAEQGKFFSSDAFQNYTKTKKDSEKRIAKMEKQLEEIGNQPNTVANSKKYDALQNRIDILKKRTQSMHDSLLPEAERIMGIKSQMRSQMMGTVKDSRLAESYNELARSKQKFQVDVNQYKNENAKKTVQSILDSGLGDNSNQFHETVEWLAKLSEDRNVTFDLTKTERLKGTKHYREGYVTNGFKTKNGDMTNITINLDGNYMNTTVGHEITHVLEEAGVYGDLSKAVKDFAIAKEGQEAYNARLSAIKEIYGEDQATIDSELTADIIGEYLFTDYDFVHSLSTQNRNGFQKIYDEIKYMVKIATAGSKEARELEKVKKMFDKAWRENVKGKPDTENVSKEYEEATPEEQEFSDAKTEYSIRKKEPPKKTIEGFKVFVVKDGKLFPPMVANPEGEGTPIGVWLDADVGGLAYDKEGNVQLNNRGRFKVKAGGKGTQGGSGELAFRPGWHLGEYPDASQFGRENKEHLVPNKKGEMVPSKELFPYNFVWARCEVAADNDYQLDAMSFGVNEKGNFERTQAGLPYIPEDGYYKYRTNANPDTAPWIISGSIKVVEILNDDQVAAECAKHGVTPQQRQAFTTGAKSGFVGEARPGGKIDLSMFGLTEGMVTPTSEDVLNQIRASEGLAETRKEETAKLLKTLPGYAKRQINFADENIIKEFAMNNQSMDDYRLMAEESGHSYLNDDKIYSSGGITEEQNEGGLDTKNEVQYSLSRDTELSDKAISMNMDKLFVEAETMTAAKELRERIASRMNDIKDRGLVALPEDVEGNTYIANSSYDGTEENTTICPRSLASEAFVDAVSEYLGRPLTVEEQIYISQDLQGRSLTPECTYCYVATDRKAYRAFLGDYISQRDAVLQKVKENPNADFSEKGVLYQEFLNGRKPTKPMYNRFKMWVEAHKNGKPMIDASHLANINKLMGDINSEFGAELKPQIVDAMKYAQSASWAKKRVNYVAYNGHILKWKQDRINKLNSHYGLRMYSFSDFHPAFVLENMQMITDASVRGLKMLGYTKDTDFVEIFAPSGMNINISTFGFETNGNVYENNIIGAEWAKAKELRGQYPNVGITFVATNDTLVEWALAQDWIDVVIPYHLVRTGTEVAKAFGYTNYTSESADTKTKDWVKGDKKSIAPTEHNNDLETYFNALEKNHLNPRFERFKNNPNYMKLVNECRQSASESKPVQPVFNEDAAMTALAKLEANGYYQPIGGSVERMYEIAAEVAENMTKEIAPTQYSMTKAEKAKMDEDYFAAIESGDEEVQKHLVREYAKASMPDSKLVDENGNLRVVYHGTNTGDFTVFNPDYIGMSSGDDGFFGMGFYFAYSKGEASYYGAQRIIPAYLNLTNPFNFQRELHTYNGKRARYGHAPDAVALMNFADKFPDIAMHITMGAIKNGESSGKQISVFEFAKAFKDIIENKEFDYQEIVNEYGETETLVTADPQVHEYEYNGETHSWRDFGFQKRFMYDHDILDVAYEYLSNALYSYIDIPRFTSVILDNNREFTAELKNRGYDGTIQSEHGDEAVAFYPNQIKSAAPITRDADGNVIPLSERFNPENDDLRYSISKGDRNTSGDWHIDGKDFGVNDEFEDFAPVGEDVATEKVADTVATGPSNVIAPEPEVAPEPEAVAPVEEVKVSAKTEGTVEKVKTKLQQKIDNTQAELDKNRQLMEDHLAYYDGEIAKKQAEYDSKKDKNSNTAQGILRSIERLKRLKANSEADYSKRISDLEKRVEKMHSEDYQRAEVRRAKQEERKQFWSDLIGDTSSWKDFKLGVTYKIKTLRRILRSVVRDGRGDPDIQLADAIYDELETKYDHNEAQLKMESRKLKEVFQKLNLNRVEDEYAQMLGELRHNPETTLSEDRVEDFLEKHKGKIDEEKVNQAISEARKLYDDLIVRVNAVLKENGMKEIPYRQGYFPHFTNPKQNWLQKLLNWKPIDTEIPTSIAGLTQDFKPNKSWQSFAQKRKGDKTDYSLYQGLDTYIHGALDWIYHVDDIQSRRALENYIREIHSDEGIEQRIQAIRADDSLDADEVYDAINAILDEGQNPLSGLVRELMNRTNTLANKKSSLDREMEDFINRKVYSTLTNLNNRITANQVVGSFSSAMTNFIPMVQSWHQVSPVYTAKGMGDYIRSVIKDDGMVEKSTFLTNRLMEEEKLFQTGWDKVSDKAGFMMNVVDGITSNTVWRSKYLQNIHEGMSESQAIKDADQFAKNLMGGRSRGNAPSIFDAKNPLVKMFTAFQLEVANQYGYMFDDVIKDSKNKARLVKGYATAFLGAYAYNALYSSLVGRDAAFDPISIIEELLSGLFDDEEEKKDVLMDFGTNILEETPFVGGVLGGGRIPLSSAFPYSGYSNPVESMLNDISEGEFSKEWLKPLWYLAMPVGGGQVKKTIEGLSMFSDDHPVAGSYTDSGNLRFPVEDTFGNKVQAALFGQYANENARDYFDNNRKTLYPDQIQEYKDVDIPIRDYWEYREGLAEFDKWYDKADYIANLDLPVDKRNILINNISTREDPIDLTGYEEYDNYEEFDWAIKNPEKYEVLSELGVSYSDYKNADEEKKKDYNWAAGYPKYVTLSKAVTNDVWEYREWYKDMVAFKADKDKNGKPISGSKKKKVIEYINNLDIDYGAKLVLMKSQYESIDDYNEEIFQYIRDKRGLTFEEKLSILKTLGYSVSDDGTITWD